jgi:type II secretory pathway component PulK
MHILLKTHRGYAILIAMVILILLSIITTVFLERIWGFAQSSEGIEQSNIAYYDAVGLIEKQLMVNNVTRYKPWNIV